MHISLYANMIHNFVKFMVVSYLIISTLLFLLEKMIDLFTSYYNAH